MKDFTLALIAHESPMLSTDENLAATIAWCEKAKRKGADFIFFPELGLTGHAGHESMVEVAQPLPGVVTDALIDVARDLDVHICAGMCEDDNGLHYNTQFIVGPSGLIGKQRKIHLSRDEYFYFRGGTEVPVFNLPFARVGIVICYDNAFPELSRCLAIDGAELILAPHAARFGKWPRTQADQRAARKKQFDYWFMQHRARANDNGVYVALTNTVGSSTTGIKACKGVEANHAGGCFVIDPAGEILAQSRTKDIAEEMLIVPIKGQAVTDIRKRTCFNLQTRRPDVFKSITRPTV